MATKILTQTELQQLGNKLGFIRIKHYISGVEVTAEQLQSMLNNNFKNKGA